MKMFKAACQSILALTLFAAPLFILGGAAAAQDETNVKADVPTPPSPVPEGSAGEPAARVPAAVKATPSANTSVPAAEESPNSTEESLTPPQTPRTPQTAAPAAPARSAENAKRKAICEVLVKNVVTPYRDLFQHLPADKAKELVNDNRSHIKLTQLPEKPCENPVQQKEVMKLTTVALASHSGKVGVLLAGTALTDSLTGHIISGMKAYFPEQKVKFSDRVIIKETGGSEAMLLQRLAELIFIDNVGVIAGGVDKNEGKILIPWAEKLMTPFLIMSSKSNYEIDNKYVFYIFPNPEDLASKIIEVMKKRAITKVAILQPTRQKPSRIVGLLTEALKDNNITAVNNITYNPMEYASMEAASKQLFQIDKSLRAEEFEALVKAAKEKAQVEKVPFKPERVTLPPKIDFDALIIPDNFRNVRHMVKIFKFLGVKNLNLFGTQEWRAGGLVDPSEPFLNNAIFVDYIGSYLEIPPGINPAMQKPPYFVHPEETASIDYKIIGNQAMRLADAVLKKPPTKKRKLAERMTTLRNMSSPYFPPGPAFTRDRRSIWPTFLFEVQGDTVVPYNMDGYKKTIPPAPLNKDKSQPPKTPASPAVGTTAVKARHETGSMPQSPAPAAIPDKS
jgi:hypothetical protein